MRQRKVNVKANTYVKRTQRRSSDENTVRLMQVLNIHWLKNYPVTGQQLMQLTLVVLFQNCLFRYLDASSSIIPKLFARMLSYLSSHITLVCLIMCRQKNPSHLVFSSHPVVWEVFLISCNTILIFYQQQEFTPFKVLCPSWAFFSKLMSFTCMTSLYIIIWS